MFVGSNVFFFFFSFIALALLGLSLRSIDYNNIWLFVFQEPVLFSGSIKENILYGALDESCEEPRYVEKIDKVSKYFIFADDIKIDSSI